MFNYYLVVVNKNKFLKSSSSSSVAASKKLIIVFVSKRFKTLHIGERKKKKHAPRITQTTPYH